MSSRPSTAAPILAVLAVLLVTLGAYIGGYYGLGTEVQAPTVTGSPVRIYRSRWQARLFAPAVRVDSYLRGIEVKVISNQEISEFLGLPP